MHIKPQKNAVMFDFTGLSPKAPFDLVFLIRLRCVERGQSLVDVIREQHDGLEGCTDGYIKSILEGDTGHRVLLMIDGYDEYTPGTNRDIDKAIEDGIGNCFLILTSRLDYLRKSIRDKLDGEIIMGGLSEENIQNKSLPKSEISKINDLLCTLGEFSWSALQNDVQRLLLEKV